MIKYFLNLLVKKSINKRSLIQFALFFLLNLNVNGQTGLNFQGVARNSNNIILASQPITIRLSILRGNLDATKTEEYIETRRVLTNAQGLFTAVIGDTGAISSLGKFANINWKLSPKYLKIEMDPNGGANFITIGTTQFQFVAYAQYAKSVDADNIIGVVPIAMGGTGVNSLTGLKNTLLLDNVNNTSDLTKPISTLTQTALDLKAPLASPTFTGTVTGITKTMVGLSNVDNTNDVNKPVSLATQTALDLKVDKVIGKMLSSNDYTNSEKTKLASISGNNTGDQDLSTYATITSITLKENISNKSNDAELGGTTPSDILFPTQKAVKAYVAANSTSGGISDAGISTIKLADLAVTDAKVANGINKSKVGLSNVDNTSDASKPVSSATQAALDLKAPLASPTFTGTVTVGSVTYPNTHGTANQFLTSTGSGTLTWTSSNVISGLNMKSTKIVGNTNWYYSSSSGPNNNRHTFYSYDLLFDSQFASDNIVVLFRSNKDVTYSNLTRTGITFTADFYGYVSNVVDAINANADIYVDAFFIQPGENTASSNSIVDAGITTIKLADLSVTDAKVATGINKSKVGLSNVDNTNDASKPISTATQTALDLKAPLVSPSFTTPSLGIATATSINSGNLTLTTALSVANGGTGTSSLTANNILLGDGTNALKFVAPGANGNVLTSNGTTWISAAASTSTATKPSYQNKFLSTGSYTVPNGVNTLLIEFNGAVGGNGSDLEVMNQYSAGCVNPYSVAGGGQSGKANKIAALLLVNAGDVISFTIGQNGSKPTTERTPCYPGYTYGTGSYGSYYASNGSAGAESSLSINGNLILSLSSSGIGSGAYNLQGQTQARTPSASTVNGSSTYSNNFDNYSITILSDAASNETTPYFKIKH